MTDEDSFERMPGARRLEEGITVHRVLESINYQSPLSRRAIREKLKQYGITDDVDKVASRIERWLLSEKAQQIASAGKIQSEFPFTVKLELHGDGRGEGIELYLSGAIDLLVWENGTGPWLIDYKYSEFKGQKEHEQQLELYYLALSQIPGMKPDRMTLVYLKGLNIAPISVTAKRLDEIKREIYELITQEWKPTIKS